MGSETGPGHCASSGPFGMGVDGKASRSAPDAPADRPFRVRCANRGSSPRLPGFFRWVRPAFDAFGKTLDGSRSRWPPLPGRIRCQPPGRLRSHQAPPQASIRSAFGSVRAPGGSGRRRSVVAASVAFSATALTRDVPGLPASLTARASGCGWSGWRRRTRAVRGRVDTCECDRLGQVAAAWRVVRNHVSENNVFSVS